MKALTLEQKLFLNGFRPDTESHLRIIDPAKCRDCEKKPCTYVCPVNTYRWENGEITIFFEGCVECGACRIACAFCKNLEWRYPHGGYGVSYRTG
jgi:ferredoxin like protein